VVTPRSLYRGLVEPHSRVRRRSCCAVVCIQPANGQASVPTSAGIKSDAENRLLLPALDEPRVKLLPRTEVLRLLTTEDGRRVTGAEARYQGRRSLAALNSAVTIAANAIRAAPDIAS